MNVGQVLANTLSSDQGLREDATRHLETAAAENYTLYVATLSQELANEESQSHIRKAAGLALKNAFTARENVRRDDLKQKWISLPLEGRHQIKQTVLRSLGSSDLGAGHTAAQVVAAIASIELPRSEWPDLIQLLLDNITSSENNNIKLCSLQAIGFTCESIDAEVLQAQSNQILTAVVQGARKEEPNIEVRYVAIKALYNCLEFIKENFEREGERNLIMQVVCEATQSQDPNVDSAAYECLARIMQLYYEKMPYYVEKALFGLTIIGMKSEEEKVALQAIEFWSTVCDEEIEIANELDELEENEQPERMHFNFANSALSQILPVLLWLLTKQEEDVDEDEWNVAMAAATCISLLAQCVQDAIVGPIIPFVESHIQTADWRYREAAVMAFGSILDGPNPEILSPLVAQALPVLIGMMHDPVVQVKDSAAWTLGRVCSVLMDCVQPDVHLNALISALVAGLEDSPKIVANCCWSLMNLSDNLSNEDIENTPYALHDYFDGIITTLMRISERPTNEQNSRTSAYEALSTLISRCGKECLPMVSNVCAAILGRLEQSIAMQSQILGIDDLMTHAELQSNLCSVLTSIIRRFGRDIAPMADKIMTHLLQLLSTVSKQSTVMEDVFLGIGALTTSLETDFARYLDSFVPFLYAALQNHEEYQLCQIAVGLVGDICRALGEQSAPYCDSFMSALVENLKSEKLDRTVKPAVLSCFGDMALAIGGRFEVYFELSMVLLAQAASMRGAPNDYDLIEYVRQLQGGILEAYVGIVQGLKSGEKGYLLLPHAQNIFGFLAVLYSGTEKTDAVMRDLIGLLGDLAETFPKGEIRKMFQEPWVSACLKEGRTNKYMSPATKETARWAREIIKSNAK